MSAIPLAKAEMLVNGALETRRLKGFSPLTVAVLDTGGHVVLLKREDNSGILRNDIAVGKAWGALGMGMSSRDIAERAAKAPAFYQSLGTVSGGRLIPGPGGVLIFDDAGELLGAVGISGDTGDNDEICALAGIEMAGLRSSPTPAAST